MSRLISVRTLIVLLAGTLMATATAQAQTTWYVDDDAPNDPGPGDPTVSDPNENGTPEHPFDAIQEGIDDAANGDTVLVLDGVYTGDGNRDLDFDGKAISVRSKNGAATCIIDCEGDGRGLCFHSGESDTSVVEGFTISNGSADYGGGVCCGGSDPSLTNCVLMGNYASDCGGGMYSDNSNPTVTDCTFKDNWAYNWGGGMCNMSSAPTVTNCTFTGNSAIHWGGGMCNLVSSPTLANCTFTGNSADLGGGVNSFVSSPKVTNCTFEENSAYNWGGGMYNIGSDTTLMNCTFSANQAYYGGGMYNHQSSPTMVNCILWADRPNEIYDDSSITTASYSDIQGGWPGSGNIDADPLFLDPNNGDCRLGTGSPCIDAGCNWAVPADTADLDDDGDTEEITPLDLDGEGRFFDDPNTPDTGCGFPPIVDMGAYEFGDTGPQPCFGDFNGDRVVNLSDLATLLANYGQTEVCEGDLDCDGDVDLSDLSALLAVYGTTCE